MRREYSWNDMRRSRASSLSVVTAVFVSALLLSLLCSLAYNLWIDQIRQIAARPAPAPLADSTRFAIETAKGLADHSPALYPMSSEVAARFRLISTFLTTALDEAHQRTQEATR